MGALTQARMGIETKWKNIALPLAAAATAFRGGIACVDSTAAVCKPGGAGTTLIKVGEFLQDIDNSAGTATVYVNVSLDTEITLHWYDSATGGNAVTSANLFAVCYMLDDHTVTTSSSGNSQAGRVWAVDPIKGVAVESLGLI